MSAVCSTASAHIAFFSLGIDAEALELDARGRFAGAPVDAAVGDEVERGDALGDAGGMVVAGRRQHHAVADADAPGARGAGGEEHLGRRGVGVLLEEVVLDLPDVVDAEPIGQLDLRQRVLEQAVLGACPSRAAAAGVRTEVRSAWLLSSVSGPAAVDDQARAGHEARIVRRQEHDALGDVVGDAEPADRMQGERGLACLARCRWCRCWRARMTKVCSPMSVSIRPGWIELTRIL